MLVGAEVPELMAPGPVQGSSKKSCGFFGGESRRPMVFKEMHLSSVECSTFAITVHLHLVDYRYII